MPELPQLLVAVGVFLGAATSGLMGFAFSAAAGAILVHVLRPSDAVPLMMMCSIGVQGASLVSLRHAMDWRGSMTLVAGGVVGLLPGLYLLFHVDAGTFRLGFGLFLATYATVMLVRPAVLQVERMGGRLHDMVVGFAGGMVGGLTAMPGALPVMWCQLRGLPKDQQRGLVQPFIALMQALAVALLFCRGKVSAGNLETLVMSLPALAAGTAVGLVLFRRVSDVRFRRAVLAVLFLSGLTLVA